MTDAADLTMRLLGVWSASRMGLRPSNFSRREGINQAPVQILVRLHICGCHIETFVHFAISTRAFGAKYRGGSP
jgi:hypothetical protein